MATTAFCPPRKVTAVAHPPVSRALERALDTADRRRRTALAACGAAVLLPLTAVAAAALVSLAGLASSYTTGYWGGRVAWVSLVTMVLVAAWSEYIACRARRHAWSLVDEHDRAGAAGPGPTA
jgi:hypothetical protein